MSFENSTGAGTVASVQISTVDGAFAAAFATPATPTKKALIVLQEIFGVTSKIRRYCDLFARDGYAALAPDLFWRMEPGVQLGYSEPEIERALGLLGRLDEERALDDIAACAKWLRQQGYSQIAMVGFCLGGKLGPLSLARGAGDAAVAFYGVGLEQRLEALRKINQPIQMHFGDKDTHVPSPAVAAIEGVAKERSNIEVLRYPEGGHGFFRPDLKNEESQVAYRRMLVFLERELPG
jgi:carboxymethylenebutenolidase